MDIESYLIPKLVFHSQIHSSSPSSRTKLHNNFSIYDPLNVHRSLYPNSPNGKHVSILLLIKINLFNMISDVETNKRNNACIERPQGYAR